MFTKIVTRLKTSIYYQLLIVAMIFAVLLLYLLYRGKMNNSQKTLYQEIADASLTGLTGEQYEEGASLVRVIVDDWIAQADGVDIQDIVEFGKEDLENKLQGKKAEEKLVTLRNIVLERQVEKLSGRTFQLAKQVVDRQKSFQEAAPEVKEIRVEIDDLLKKVKQLPDGDLKKRLLRNLADSDLETIYILEEGKGAMSIRLNNYAQPAR
jgi:hypothetical protein